MVQPRQPPTRDHMQICRSAAPQPRRQSKKRLKHALPSPLPSHFLSPVPTVVRKPASRSRPAYLPKGRYDARRTPSDPVPLLSPSLSLGLLPMDAAPVVRREQLLLGRVPPYYPHLGDGRDDLLDGGIEELAIAG